MLAIRRLYALAPFMLVAPLRFSSFAGLPVLKACLELAGLKLPRVC